MFEVNRSVIIVIPEAPFWHWLKQLPNTDLGDLQLEDLQMDANSYLIDACQNADEVWEKIEAHIETIFAAELADWCEDEHEWPDLAPEIFGEWFNIELSSIVTDLSQNALEREPFEPLHL